MSFWQQDAEKIIVTFPGPPSGALNDVDVVLTQNSFRAGVKSTGVTVCDSGLFSSIKSATAHYGIKSRNQADGSVSFSVVVYMEKANHGEQWPSLFQPTAAENATFMPVITKVRTTYPYAAEDPNELGFPQGAIITVLFQDPSGWWVGYYEGKQGNFPSNFVEVIDSTVAEFEVDDPNNVVYTSRSAAAGPMGAGRGRMGGFGFGAALTGELGKALKRRTVIAPAGGQQQPQQQPQPAPQPMQPMQPQQPMQPMQQMQPARPSQDDAARREAEALAESIAMKQMQGFQQAAPAEPQQQQQQQQSGDAVLPQITLEPGMTQLKATADYTGGDGELSFHVGDIITVWGTDPSGWWEGECGGIRGWFPANFTQAITPARPAGPPHAAVPVMPQQPQQPEPVNPEPAAAEPVPVMMGGAPAMRGRGGGGAGRGAPSGRGKRPSQVYGSSSSQEQPQQGGGGGLPFAVNLKPRAPQPEQPKPAEEQQSGGLPFAFKLKSVSQEPKPAPAPQPQEESNSGGGLPFPVKLRSAGAQQQEAQPAQPAQPQPQPQPGPKPQPAAKRPVPGRPAPSGQPQPQAGPKPAPAAPAGGAGPVRDWPSSLPDFDSFASSVQSMVSGANVRGAQSRNLAGLPNERGSAVCSLDGHVRSSGTKEAVPLAAAIAPVLFAYCQKNGCAPSSHHLASLDALQAAIVLTAACAKDKINAPWEVVASITAFVNSLIRGTVGFSLASYMKAKQGSENVWSRGFELKMRRVLPEGSDVQAVMDLYFQLSSMQVTMEEGARLAAGLAKEGGVASFASGACSLLRDKHVAAVGGESGLALAILPKVGGIAVFAGELTGDASVPAIAGPVLGGLADKHADVFAC